MNLQDRHDLCAQWSLDTRPILGRFHLWLENVAVAWSRGEPAAEFVHEMSFLDGRMERLFAMTGAVTALGTQLFGRFGEGAHLDKASLNQVKKDDVVGTVYSTMLVETAVHDTPMIAATIDAPNGWNHRKKFSLSLKEIGEWPTHKRFRDAKAGRVAMNENELRDALNMYLKDRTVDAKQRSKFVQDEITFTDASSGKRTAEFILKIMNS